MKVFTAYSRRAIRAWCATSQHRSIDSLLMAFDDCDYCLDAVDPPAGSHQRLDCDTEAHVLPTTLYR